LSYRGSSKRGSRLYPGPAREASKPFFSPQEGIFLSRSGIPHPAPAGSVGRAIVKFFSYPDALLAACAAKRPCQTPTKATENATGGPATQPA